MMQTNRRPLASRQTHWAHKISTWLANTRITPNQISIGSMVFAGIAGLGFALSANYDGVTRISLLLIAVLCCQLRLLCNLFDGMVAVEAGKQTKDGPAWNEFPDRIADIMILVGCGIGAGAVALGWAAACFAVMTAYIRELGVANHLPADFSGPMAKQHRMATVTVAGLLSLVLPGIMGLSTLAIALWLMIAGTTFTVLRRILNLLRFLNTNEH